MLFSMTGFSSRTVCLPINKEEKALFLIEIKSVNSRFFEVLCKLPSALNHLEIKLSQKLKSKLIRGRVYFAIKPEEDSGVLETVKPSLKLIGGYINAIKEVKSQYKLPGDISVADILNLPDIFITQKNTFSQNFEKEILSQVDIAVDELLESRATEGKNLQKDLEKRFEICQESIAKIKTLFERMMKKYKGEVQELLPLQKDCTEQVKLKLDELYSVLNKIDVHEEITRFKSHLDRIKKVTKEKSEEKGKRLDFVLQELMREANTILAKCSDGQISSMAVDIKVELEKAREQAQNIV